MERDVLASIAPRNRHLMDYDAESRFTTDTGPFTEHFDLTRRRLTSQQ